jgi:hypothetical protein
MGGKNSKVVLGENISKENLMLFTILTKYCNKKNRGNMGLLDYFHRIINDDSSILCDPGKTSGNKMMNENLRSMLKKHIISIKDQRSPSLTNMSEEKVQRC